jgi:hypothetical protein
MVLTVHQNQVPLHQLAQVFMVVLQHPHLVLLILLRLTEVIHTTHVQVHAMVRHLVVDIVVDHLVVVTQDQALHLHQAHAVVMLAEELADFLVAPEVDLQVAVQVDLEALQDLAEMAAVATAAVEALVEETEEEDVHQEAAVLIFQDSSTKQLWEKK